MVGRSILNTFMGMNLSKKLEITGLIFLLISFGWECVSLDLRNNKTEDYLSVINHKVDLLWENELTKFSHSNTTGMAMGVDIGAVNKQWETHEEFRRNYTMADNQIEVCDWIQLILYVLGSGLIIMSKCLNNDKER